MNNNNSINNVENVNCLKPSQIVALQNIQSSTTTPDGSMRQSPRPVINQTLTPPVLQRTIKPVKFHLDQHQQQQSSTQSTQNSISNVVKIKTGFSSGEPIVETNNHYPSSSTPSTVLSTFKDKSATPSVSSTTTPNNHPIPAKRRTLSTKSQNNQLVTLTSNMQLNENNGSISINNQNHQQQHQERQKSTSPLTTNSSDSMVARNDGVAEELTTELFQHHL